MKDFAKGTAMPAPVVTRTRIAEGVWEGRVQQPGAGPDTPPPAIRIMLGDQPVHGAELEPVETTPGLYILRIPIPPEALGEGLYSILIVDDDSGTTLEDFSVGVGLPIESDIRAELEQLRAELDLLKRAFRRHCVETM